MFEKIQPVHYLIGIAVLVVGVVGLLAIAKDRQPGEYDELAACLTEKGVKFYGAFWCPHCQEQKRMFGNSASKLPYVECSTPDGKSQTQICSDLEIKSYPTWIFADESRLTGAIPLLDLASKAGCELPAKTE